MINRNRNKKNQHNPFYDPSLKKRHTSARRFKKFTMTSLIFSIAFLAFFLFDIIAKGAPAFTVTYIKVDVTYNEKTANNYRKIIDRDYRAVLSRAWLRETRQRLIDDPSLMNTSKPTWVLADDQVDQYIKGHHHTLNSKEIAMVERLKAKGLIERKFNKIFFTQGDSKSPEYAGYSQLLLVLFLHLLSQWL